ncbi:MAG: hypothetical protein V8S97_06775 [Oscillospiraceae bacterium]
MDEGGAGRYHGPTTPSSMTKGSLLMDGSLTALDKARHKAITGTVTAAIRW